MATCSVQWRTVHKGGDPNTDQAQRGLTHNSQAGNPKRTRPDCRKNENSQRGWHQSKKGRGPENPAAQEVKAVVAPLASMWLLWQLRELVVSTMGLACMGVCVRHCRIR